jgi:hypothetical protein
MQTASFEIVMSVSSMGNSSHQHMILFGTGIAWALLTAVAGAGNFPPPGGLPGATAIVDTDPRIVEWASGAMIQRGLREIDNPALGYAFYGGLNGGTTSIGAATANGAPLGPPPQPPQATYAVALGQGGIATLTFDRPITNGPGADFAVYGNGFTSSVSGTAIAEWVKPAFVEVSSDGVHFFRFPAVSLTPAQPQVASGGTLDPTNLYNLAGKDPAGYGTPFDLSELAGVSPMLDISDVTEVRVVDCVGDINPDYATYDSQGNVINSPWPASSFVGSEGFALAGVGVINVVPEPGTFTMVVVCFVAGLLASRSCRLRT